MTDIQQSTSFEVQTKNIDPSTKAEKYFSLMINHYSQRYGSECQLQIFYFFLSSQFRYSNLHSTDSIKLKRSLSNSNRHTGKFYPFPKLSFPDELNPLQRSSLFGHCCITIGPLNKRRIIANDNRPLIRMKQFVS